MSRVAVANHAKLSWLLLRGAMRRLAGRVNGHPLRALAALAAQGRPAPDRAAGFAHRRRHAGERNLCRPFRLRRQGRGLRRPLDLRDGAAVGRMGGGAARLRLAAPSARRGIRHHPRQCPRAGRRMDHAARLLASASPGARMCCRAASSPGSASPRSFCTTPTCASTGASCAAWSARCAICAIPRAMRAAASRACRPPSRSPMPRSASPARRATSQSTTERLKQRDRAANPSRRRPCQPRSRRDHRDIARIFAAAAGLRLAQHRAAAGAAQRHRPHDADAALLPPFRGNVRAFQRHGRDAGAIWFSTLLAYDETRGAPLSNAPYSAYQRVEAGGGVRDHGYRPRAADRNEPRCACRVACRSNSRRRSKASSS